MRRGKDSLHEEYRPKSIRVLLIEDNPGDTGLTRKALAEVKDAVFDLECVDRLQVGLQRLAKGEVDVALLDLGLPDSQGLDTLAKVHAQAPEVPIVVLTGAHNETLAVKALKQGAQDYLVKGEVNSHLLVRTIRYAVERHRMLTELKEHARELQASKANFRNIIEKNADAIIVVDRNGIVCFVNPAAKAFFARKAEDLLGNLFGFPAVAGETTEIDIIGRGGVRAIAEMRVVETEWEGEVAYLASLRDITERKLLEDAKSELVSNVSHELRTPLTSMRNVVSNVQAGVAGKIKGRLKEYMEMLDRDCRRLCGLVDNLLDMSRFDAGKISLGRDMLDLRQPARQAALAYRSQAQEKIIAVNLEIPASVPLVYADESRIQQVFMNLVGNAIKFTPEGGAITIRAEERGDNILASVTDTGVGIASLDCERVFEKFVQVGRQPGQGYKGTGLGLAICKDIVSLHGGEIWVESEVGKGSTFLFTLHKAEPDIVLKEELKSAIEGAKAEDSTLSLLLVEIQETGKRDYTQEEAREIIDEVGQVIKASLRGRKDMVIRCGDNQIAIVLLGVHESNRAGIEKRVAEQIRKHQGFIKKPASFSVLVGAASYPAEGTTAADLLERAWEKLRSSILIQKKSAQAAWR